MEFLHVCVCKMYCPGSLLHQCPRVCVCVLCCVCCVCGLCVCVCASMNHFNYCGAESLHVHAAKDSCPGLSRVAPRRRRLWKSRYQILKRCQKKPKNKVCFWIVCWSQEPQGGAGLWSWGALQCDRATAWLDAASDAAVWMQPHCGRWVLGFSFSKANKKLLQLVAPGSTGQTKDQMYKSGPKVVNKTAHCHQYKFPLWNAFF